MLFYFSLLLLLCWFYFSGAVSAVGYEHNRPAVLLIGIAMFVFGFVSILVLSQGLRSNQQGGSK